MKYKSYTLEELYEALSNFKASYNLDDENECNHYYLERDYIQQLIDEKNVLIFDGKYKNHSLADIRLSLCKINIELKKNRNNLIEENKFNYRKLQDESNYLDYKLEGKEFDRLDLKYSNYNLRKLKKELKEIRCRLREVSFKLEEIEQDEGMETNNYIEQCWVYYELSYEEYYLSDSIAYGWYKDNFNK